MCWVFFAFFNFGSGGGYMGSWICKNGFVFCVRGMLQLFLMNDGLSYANGDERGILFAVLNHLLI